MTQFLNVVFGFSLGIATTIVVLDVVRAERRRRRRR